MLGARRALELRRVLGARLALGQGLQELLGLQGFALGQGLQELLPGEVLLVRYRLLQDQL